MHHEGRSFRKDLWILQALGNRAFIGLPLRRCAQIVSEPTHFWRQLL